MNFPKHRNGFTGPGNSAANFLGGYGEVWLRKRRGNAIALNRGGLLETRVDQTGLAAPFLWALAGSYANPFGLRLRTVSTQTPTTVVRPAARVVPAGLPSAGEFKENAPGGVYVGGGYVLRTSRFESLSGAGFDRLVRCWPVLTQVGQPAAEVASGATTVPPRANISFADATVSVHGLNSFRDRGTYPVAFAAGYDPAAQAFIFGAFGGVADFEDRTVRNFVMRGNTTDRSMTRVETGITGGTGTHIVATARGRLMGVRGFPADYPQALTFFRSDDFGQTWSVQEAPEITPYLARYLLAGSPSYCTQEALYAPTVSQLTPIGGGRVALVVIGSSVVGGNLDIGDADPTSVIPQSMWRKTRWKLFISDEEGRNFVNVPWPADAWCGLGIGFLPSGGVTPAQMFCLHPGCLFDLDPATHFSAGPGSFFMSVSRIRFGADDVGTQSIQMLWTRDYGATWTLSEDLPEAAVPFPTDTSVSNAYYRPVRAVVTRAATASSAGEVHILTMKNDQLRVHRTTAEFRTFTEVFATELTGAVGDLVLGKVHGVYVGSAGAGHRPHIHAGFPSLFDRI